MPGHGKGKEIAVGLLVALALTLVVNFPFLLFLFEVPMHKPRWGGSPGLYIAVQFAYFYLFSLIAVRLNTLKGCGTGRKIAASLCLAVLFYLFAPEVRGGAWQVQLFDRRLFSPVLSMKCLFVLIVSVLYGKIYELVYQKQRIAVENSLLKTENLQTRYNMLVSQISPHFLFNSLNSLSMLVREKSGDRALLYIDRMADTFRYMLRSGCNEMTTLESELAFAEAYLYLHTIRYENKLFCELDIDPRYRQWLLPVVSLQPLIENAVKHNSITLTRPFTITIRTEKDRLVVSNPVIAKIDTPERTGIGLKNLSSRYQLLIARDIRVRKENGTFCVELPLTPPGEHK